MILVPPLLISIASCTSRDLLSCLENNILVKIYLFKISILFTGCTAFNLTNLPSSVSCQLDPLCLGIQCCLSMDFRIAHITAKTWLLFDACDYELSIGLGSWYLNISLFSYSWGMEDVRSIGNALNVRYVCLFI